MLYRPPEKRFFESLMCCCFLLSPGLDVRDMDGGSRRFALLGRKDRSYSCVSGGGGTWRDGCAYPCGFFGVLVMPEVAMCVRRARGPVGMLFFRGVGVWSSCRCAAVLLYLKEFESCAIPGMRLGLSYLHYSQHTNFPNGNERCVHEDSWRIRYARLVTWVFIRSWFFQVLLRYHCADLKDFFPHLFECASDALEVMG